MSSDAHSVALQRAYYERTAADYDALHLREDDEHHTALAWLAGLLHHHGATSVLDVGCGTGRALRYLARHCPDVRLTGIEPSEALRRQALDAGMPAAQMLDGDATALPFADASFDVVCEFGVLHHIERPRRAVEEMLRVARLAVFISDDNHFAAGSALGRRVKQGLHGLGLWPLAYRLRTGGKGYRISEGDGLTYPYSVFDDLEPIRAACASVQCASTAGGGPDLYRTAAHVAVFGLKRQATAGGRA